MGLPALEFSDCYLDSPQFRERLKSHELELDNTNKFIKELIKDGKALIQALKNLSTAQRKFAESLNEFKFQCIGDAETDDEICIARSLQEFAGVLQNLEDERTRMIDNANDVLITPLERFRKEQIGVAKEAKKKYDKETEKYCAVLEKHLSLSAKKKEAQLLEADSQVDHVRQHFYEVSLEYVFKVQEVQERKMFEFVEPLLAFLQGLFTYYHHGYELAKDFNHFKTDLTISIQNTRNRFESTRSEVESLMRKMKENPHEHKNISPNVMEGYLFILEKRSFVSTWVKYYCTYQRESKRLTIVLFDQKSGGKIGEEESFVLKSCIRRKTDSIEKRFCFDVEAVDRPGVMITMQALSEEDRKLWMEAMDGREPVYNMNRDSQNEAMAQLDVIGFNIIKKFIYAIETRGIDEQGLYRIVGVSSRVQKLLSLTMDPKTCADVELESSEWEIKTITSAIKHYLRMLPAPLMTYQYQRSFIKAAKLDNPEARVQEIHSIVHRLPEKNRQMLELLMKHLANVASHHQQNLMTVANLGVVFGPTLLRPQEETVAAIMDIKFQNIVVEILIENHERIFKETPVPGAGQSSSQTSVHRRKSTESKAPSCSERPLTLFHTPTHSEKERAAVDKRNSVHLNSEPQPALSSLNCNSNQNWNKFINLSSGDGEQDSLLQARQSRSNSHQIPRTRGSSISTSSASPSSTSPRSPSWPMFSAPSSPQSASCISREFSPLSAPPRKARALYACKAEHDSELSFIAGTIFDNVHPSREPGWLEGTLDGRTGLIPENYVEFL
ncbi:rho GTPase-activating protein 26-like isoform X1 [Hemibagrus wyckioides]|uniref:rho GTPase-activating protein 26-like isoform X1 n=1 Tax=Hemibagrus wyckioides TaxID=337641 RepID=UPI00266CC52C|nr:rho GTPase-activating protein 26-like isoform X1 [Hemibagrus wyckioides]